MSESINYGICDVFAGFSTTGRDGRRTRVAGTHLVLSPAPLTLVSLTPRMRVFGRLFWQLMRVSNIRTLTCVVHGIWILPPDAQLQQQRCHGTVTKLRYVC